MASHFSADIVSSCLWQYLLTHNCFFLGAQHVNIYPIRTTQKWTVKQTSSGRSSTGWQFLLRKKIHSVTFLRFQRNPQMFPFHERQPCLFLFPGQSEEWHADKLSGVDHVSFYYCFILERRHLWPLCRKSFCKKKKSNSLLQPTVFFSLRKESEELSSQTLRQSAICHFYPSLPFKAREGAFVPHTSNQLHVL